LRPPPLRFESLEDRLTPATLHWLGTSSSSWALSSNWAEGFIPTAGDTLVFDTTAAGFAGTAAAFAPNNDISGLTGLSIVINDASSAGDFTIGGSAIGLLSPAGTAITSTVSVGTGATVNNPITLAANTTVNVGLRTLTLGGAVSGAFTLTQASSPGATLMLTGVNTYSGGTVVASGTLALGGASNGDNSVGSGPITLSGGILSSPSGFTTLANSFTVTAPSVIGGGGFFTINGNGVLNATLTCTNTGFLTL